MGAAIIADVDAAPVLESGEHVKPDGRQRPIAVHETSIEQSSQQWTRGRTNAQFFGFFSRLLVVNDCQTKPRLGCAYLEMTLMNFDYWGAVNFVAIIIGR